MNIIDIDKATILDGKIVFGPIMTSIDELGNTQI